MTENRYDDELLSSIIDGEATPESVAAVEADPVAQQRLADMAAGVESVARPVPEATPERRSQSIAAAMAAATPASPEVTSLSAQRHKHNEEKLEKEKNRHIPGWLIAVAAAVLLFVLATPVLFDNGAVDTATDAVESTADEVAEAVTGDDAEAEFADDAADGDTADDDAADDTEEAEVAEAEEDVAADEEEAVAESADAAGAADESVDEFTDLDIEVVTSIEDLDMRIDDATITPDLTSTDILSFDTSLARSGTLLEEVLATEVNPDCFAGEGSIENPTPYAIVVLDPFAGGPSLVIVEFLDDQTSRVLNAQTCAVLR